MSINQSHRQQRLLTQHGCDKNKIGKCICKEDYPSGPLKERKFTDIYGIAKGSPEKLFDLQDSDQKPCGKADRKDQPYLQILQPGLSIKNAVCVKSCTTNTTQPDCFLLDSMAGSSSCEAYMINHTIDRLPTQEYLGKVCIPTSTISDVSKSIKDSILLGGITQSFSDVNTVKWSFLITAAFTLLSTVFMAILIYYCGGCIIYFSILSFIVLQAALIYLCIGRPDLVNQYTPDWAND